MENIIYLSDDDFETLILPYTKNIRHTSSDFEKYPWETRAEFIKRLRDIDLNRLTNTKEFKFIDNDGETIYKRMSTRLLKEDY